MKKFYNILLISIIGIAVAIAVTAFNNPSGNPPTGGGALGVGSNAPASSLYINSSGNVGIGTTNPAMKLHVVGQMQINQSTAQYLGELYGADNGLYIKAGTGTNPALTVYNNTGTSLLHVRADGNVGIGTATPGAKLDVNGVSIFKSASGIAHVYLGFNDGTRDYGVYQWQDAGTAPANYFQNNVGIGTTDPGTNKLKIFGGNLDLSGNNITGVNKLTVNSIDPVFKINGQQYVTYVPDSIGQKVEVVGQGQLVNGEWSIDLSQQKENSDLWLFYQIVKPETIIPFVSSQSSASLYAYIAGSNLVVKLKDGDSQARFSYRLIASRIDQKTDYLTPETKSDVYIDVDSLKK